MKDNEGRTSGRPLRSRRASHYKRLKKMGLQEEKHGFAKEGRLNLVAPGLDFVAPKPRNPFLPLGGRPGWSELGMDPGWRRRCGAGSQNETAVSPCPWVTPNANSRTRSDCGADALILDLEDLVAPARKAFARVRRRSASTGATSATGRFSCGSTCSIPASPWTISSLSCGPASMLS